MYLQFVSMYEVKATDEPVFSSFAKEVHSVKLNQDGNVDLRRLI